MTKEFVGTFASFFGAFAAASKALMKASALRGSVILTFVKMLEAAGLSIAMGNGFDSVKQVADYVTDTAKNDGIIKALKKFSII